MNDAKTVTATPETLADEKNKIVAPGATPPQPVKAPEADPVKKV